MENSDSVLQTASKLEQQNTTSKQLSNGYLVSAKAGLLLTLVLSVFAVAPLLYPGFIQTHSGFVPVWNIADLRLNLGNLGWAPHTLTSFNPFRGDGLLPYYLAALLPITPVIAMKIIVGGSWLAGGVGIYLWLRSWIGNAGALISALVYVYLPYQIATVYVRGAWAETLFWGLFPWAILAATYLVTSPRWVLLPAAAVCWLLLGLTQFGLTLWAAVFVAALLLTVHRKQMFLPALSIISGVTLAGIIVFSLASSPLVASPLFTDHFLYSFQLFSAYWGFGPSRPGWNDGLSLQVGLAALGLTIIAVALWQRSGSTRPQPISRADRRLIFFSTAALVFLLLMLGGLALLPGVSSTLTYPWQLLGFVGLCLAVLAGVALWIEPSLARLPLLTAVIIVVILSVYPYLSPQFLQPNPTWLNGPQAELGAAQLTIIDHTFDVATSGHTAGLERGQTALPLAVNGPLRPGDTLLVNVAWQPLQLFADNLKVFVHLVDSNDNVLAQFDGQPQTSKYPTSQWVPGEVIQDSYPLTVPADAPPGPYRVFVGLYDEATLERLPVSGDSAGRIILKTQ